MRIIIEFPDPDRIEGMATDELLLHVAQMAVIAERIATEGYELPKPLSDSLRLCRRELDHKLDADLDRVIENEESRRTAMATIQERRDASDQRLAELKAKRDQRRQRSSAGA